jgi:hypothetical protein
VGDWRHRARQREHVTFPLVVSFGVKMIEAAQSLRASSLSTLSLLNILPDLQTLVYSRITAMPHELFDQTGVSLLKES